MHPLVIALAVLAAFATALFAWGWARLRRNAADLAAAFAAVRPEEIPALAGTCANVFAARLGTPLDAADPVGSARIVDEAVRSLRATGAFARDGLEWAYALHCGAYIGELVRMHAGGTWEAQDDGAPALVLRHGEAVVRLWPFDKILKHRMQGESGDLAAYVEVALQGPERLLERTGTAD